MRVRADTPDESSQAIAPKQNCNYSGAVLGPASGVSVRIPPKPHSCGVSHLSKRARVSRAAFVGWPVQGLLNFRAAEEAQEPHATQPQVKTGTLVKSPTRLRYHSTDVLRSTFLPAKCLRRTENDPFHKHFSITALLPPHNVFRADIEEDTDRFAPHCSQKERLHSPPANTVPHQTSLARTIPFASTASRNVRLLLATYRNDPERSRCCTGDIVRVRLPVGPVSAVACVASHKGSLLAQDLEGNCMSTAEARARAEAGVKGGIKSTGYGADSRVRG